MIIMLLIQRYCIKNRFNVFYTVLPADKKGVIFAKK